MPNELREVVQRFVERVKRRRRDRQHLRVLAPVLHGVSRQQFVEAELVDWPVDRRQPFRHAAQMELAAELRQGHQHGAGVLHRL